MVYLLEVRKNNLIFYYKLPKTSANKLIQIFSDEIHKKVKIKAFLRKIEKLETKDEKAISKANKEKLIFSNFIYLSKYEKVEFFLYKI